MRKPAVVDGRAFAATPRWQPLGGARLVRKESHCPLWAVAPRRRARAEDEAERRLPEAVPGAEDARFDSEVLRPDRGAVDLHYLRARRDGRRGVAGGWRGGRLRIQPRSPDRVAKCYGSLQQQRSSVAQKSSCQDAQIAEANVWPGWLKPHGFPSHTKVGVSCTPARSRRSPESSEW